MPGTTDTGNHCVWCETPITLPFPFVLYDQTFNAVNVSSSGGSILCARTTPPTTWKPACLRHPNNCPFDYTIFPLWYEWGTLPRIRTVARLGQTGAASSPRFPGLRPTGSSISNGTVIDRQNSVQTGNFEVRLYENSPNKRFDVIYGSITQDWIPIST